MRTIHNLDQWAENLVGSEAGRQGELLTEEQVASMMRDWDADADYGDGFTDADIEYLTSKMNELIQN
jgi:hypothetical protein